MVYANGLLSFTRADIAVIMSLPTYCQGSFAVEMMKFALYEGYPDFNTDAERVAFAAMTGKRYEEGIATDADAVAAILNARFDARSGHEAEDD